MTSHAAQAGDLRGKALAVTALGALGVVFGDIGTSPLYAFREAFAHEDLQVGEETVVGVLSLIFWALILVVTVKYLLFVMRADNDGEGGILALTSLIMSKGPRSRGRVVLIAVGLFGTALLYGDGMITPAISVLSAVEGLEVATPSVGPWVLVIACAILVLLFGNQHRGTAALGALFGPIMVAWFSVLALLGVTQIAKEPGVLKAVSPLEFLEFARDQPRLTFLALGGVFLVVTGSEALYADMGHFGRKPIRLGWFGLVFPALVLNYFGQGALLMRRPETIENPFYEMAPGWAVIPLVVLATGATVIASQALISGAYSLTSQAIKLGYLPRMRIDHTSSRHVGQIYVPGVNWLLMIASVGLVLGFGSSTNLAAAYGVGVATDMVITTILLAVVMRVRWHWAARSVAALTLLFLLTDVVFFGANILKVPSGGWFPLVIGLIGFTLMVTWKKGTALTAARMSDTELPVEKFVKSIGEHPQLRVPGTGVYMFARPMATPPALLTNLRHHEVLHETIVLVAVEFETTPRVPQARRVTISHFDEGFHQIVLHFGFMDEVDVPSALESIVARGFGLDPARLTYFLGKETVIPTDFPGMQLWREHLFAFMHRNSGDAARSFELPPQSVVEVGVQVTI
jgi:KUP system potassium uptake protein